MDPLMFRNTESLDKQDKLNKLIDKTNRKNSNTGKVDGNQRLVNIGMYLHCGPDTLGGNDQRIKQNEINLLPGGQKEREINKRNYCRYKKGRDQIKTISFKESIISKEGIIYNIQGGNAQ